MTLLEIIRNKTGLITTIIGISLFSFIIGDFIRSGSFFFYGGKENIAIVNGKSISYIEYQKQIEEYIDTKNSLPLTMYEQNKIKQRILNEMIDRILFLKEAKKLGLKITKNEYKTLVFGDPISPILQQIKIFQNPTTKKFDKTIFLQFLQIIKSNDDLSISETHMQELNFIKKTWLNIKKMIIEDKIRQKLCTIISSIMFTNHLEGKALYEDQKLNVSFNYVSQSYSDVSSKGINISNAEIQNLYNNHKHLYKKTESRKIDYIIAKIIPSKKDYQLIENKLKMLKKKLKHSEPITNVIQNNLDIIYLNNYEPYNKLNENKKKFINQSSIGSVSDQLLIGKTYNLYKLEEIKTNSDSIKLNMLQIPQLKIKTGLNHLCDSLLYVLEKGVHFSKVALKISKGETNGEFGWVTESQLELLTDKLFKDKIFKINTKTPTIIKSNKGIFLIQITDKTKPIRKYKIANIQIKATPSQETKKNIYNRINRIISSSHSLQSIKNNAKKAGFLIYEGVNITKDQININKIQNTKPIIKWAFNHKKGTISRIYECQNSEYFIVAIVKECFKKGVYPSLSSVEDLLKYELINNKKKEKLINYYKSKSFSTLKQYANAMNTVPKSVQYVNFTTKQIPTIGEEPVLNVKILESTINQILGPCAGKSKIYVLYITDKKINKDPYNKKYEKEIELYNNYYFNQTYQVYKLLRENAKIKNNFTNLFE